MRILLSIIALCFCVSFANNAGAEYVYHSTDLVNKIKPNLTVRSKPTSNFIKLASVQFLGGTRKELNYGCPEGQGWSITEDGCVVNPCDGYNYVAGSPELEMCTSTSSCMSGTLQKYKCEGCVSGYNLTLKDGRCLCDTATYPHNNLDKPCPVSGNTVADKTDMCIEIKNSGTKVEYYKGCVCPEGWIECNPAHLLEGVGPACTSLEGIVKYSSCECPLGYTELCEDDNEVGVGKHCLWNGARFYKSCRNCDESKGEIHNEDEYWCGPYRDTFTPWIDIKEIYSSFIKLK